MRICAECNERCYPDDFSTNQWAKGPGFSRCMDCVSNSQQSVQCEVCKGWYRGDNDLKQHMKSHPSCTYCQERFTNRISLSEHVSDDHYVCPTCDRDFEDQNQLTQHMKVHMPKNVICPICKNKMFASAANAVAHVESGYCPGCRGRPNALAQIHQFVSRNASMLCVPTIENGSGTGGLPERPYRCTHCSKTFKTLSAQMNHEGDVHRKVHRLQEIGW